MKYTLLSALLTFISLAAFAQSAISGKITDDQNKPIPFASIYIKNTTKGSSANADGEYTLHLKPGTYDVLFKAVGYKQEGRHITLTENQTINVVLQTETYELKDVVIKAGAEDPAYAIIRQAIKKRKYHLKEVKAFTADVYIKGLQKLLAAPKKFLGFDIQRAARENGLDSNRRGIVYLSESQSKYSFQRPNNVHEEVISSKVSGRNQAFTFNRASDLQVNFYENIMDWRGVSNRPLISPIADNALFYYKYKYIGLTIENGETVNKIQVIPKRAYDACFQGYIYILDDSWRIYSADLFITKKQNLNFIDTLKVNEQFLPVDQKAWMPSSLKFEFTGGFLSFRLGGYFIAIYKDYDLNPTFAKNEFTETLRVTKDVIKKDSAYWQQERPIPLTEEEKTDYIKKAVLAKKRESKTYLDSIDNVHNKVSLTKLLLNGYDHSNRYEHKYLHLDPLLNSFEFNTVQGFKLNYGGTFRKLIDSATNSHFSITGKANYGFADRKLNGTINAILQKNSSLTLGFEAGSDIINLNNTYPVTPLVNTFYSLFERQNYEKFYQKQYLSFLLSTRITGGWLAYGKIEYADRKSLTNNSSYSFFDPGNHKYTSNNPHNPAQDEPLFPQNQSFKVALRTTYDFSDKYETYPNGRRYLPSPYPTLGLNFTKAFKNVLGADVDYDLLSADISKSDIFAGVFGRSSFFVGAGKFLNNSQLYYPDYKQFQGNQVFFLKGGINSYLLLNYYNFSTFTEYIEGHFEQNFSGFILNKIPLIRKLKLQEIVDINYLYTPNLKNYTELGAGVQYLNFRLMYGHSFNSGSNTNSAIRLGISF